MKITNITLILVGLVILVFAVIAPVPHSITWRTVIGLLGCFSIVAGICKLFIKKN